MMLSPERDLEFVAEAGVCQAARQVSKPTTPCGGGKNNREKKSER